ncbi:MAG: protein-tyrosine-phosphatase [Flavobacteriia bacterium]|nr:protein-tyrosine-phosphatase [Flavobacteriia bacterium]OIP46267.1 MAG: protein-tyrosine-phosphatase [Flavobacteriaceae bacterium CG2_30_31_66]PIV95953.1 MAG: protein-tyrosine-phosphatase [Flavobacteriaceae bacterium CG17_big_fil_post_rev_8_21_14_2_50_31_13]PIX13563.1 MAG: protein-tyrosine-phosphatase [Flavobacteriaceae bacterium CG_4_8_14_3_um_filter_31_8]PIY16288.1 MAG: protein-tyrosine-phosphatase [Flavobacteriaceae bacterium CG_4_10_14_3_um_filter_31_253]PIZ11949.1 MAG: protein-tyrosine-
MKKSTLFPEIAAFINSLDISTISEERKKTLQTLIDFVQSKVSHQETVAINFICTHNSRRSHLSQVWAQTIAYSLGIKNVICYSGGTEATAMFPMAVKTLENSGFQIQTLSEGKNPVYAIKYAENEHPIIGFSKKLDDDFNPKSQFAAIMTCDSANEACPFVVGAEKRIPITFLDPKAFDNTPQQAEKYHERSVQIATEMLFVFSNVK